MTEDEKKSWNELAEYVRHEVMGYTDQGLTKTMVLRLKGLATGKYLANNYIQDKANYSYKIILLAFQFCDFFIKKAIQTKNFKNEVAKLNYICRIVEDKLPDVYYNYIIKIKNVEDSSKTIDRVFEEMSVSNTDCDVVNDSNKLTKWQNDNWY